MKHLVTELIRQSEASQSLLQHQETCTELGENTLKYSSHLDPFNDFPSTQLSRWKFFIPKQLSFDWVIRETFLKILSSIPSRIGFEIEKNTQGQFSLYLLAPEFAYPTLITAFNSQFSSAILESAKLDAEYCSYTGIVSNLQPHLLCTTYDEFITSSLDVLIEGMLNHNGSILYQCLFQTASPRWNKVITQSRDHQYFTELSQNPFLPLTQQGSQTPHHFMQKYSERLHNKIHPDKPLYAFSGRIATTAKLDSKIFERFCSQFRIEGHHPDVEHRLCKPSFITNGFTNKPGLILNSKELVGFAHIPDLRRDNKYHQYFSFSSEFQFQANQNTGVILGKQLQLSQNFINLPEKIRLQGLHFIGSSGAGKSTILKQLMHQDILEGDSVIFIDPHGLAVKEYLTSIPQEHLQRCIYFNPQYTKHVWNPLQVPHSVDPNRHTLEVLHALEHTFTGWGDRMGHVLRNALIGLQQLPHATLKDLLSLVRRKSPEGEMLRAQILASTDLEEPVRAFWKVDFYKDYREVDLASSKHKLSQLLTGNTLRLFSQPKSTFNVHQILEEKQILLVDLSDLPQSHAKVIGSLFLHECQSAILGRSSTSSPASLYVDECHLFATAHSLESMLVQARKFRLRLHLAHQYLNQFDPRQVDALQTAGCTISGRINTRDAHKISSIIGSKVTTDQLVQLPQFEFIARLGHDVAHFESIPFSEPMLRTAKDAIEDLDSVIPAQDLEETSVGSQFDFSNFTEEDFAYETFD